MTKEYDLNPSSSGTSLPSKWMSLALSAIPTGGGADIDRKDRLGYKEVAQREASEEVLDKIWEYVEFFSEQEKRHAEHDDDAEHDSQDVYSWMH